MAKQGGFPGGMPGNMGQLMKKAQEMQEKLQKEQENLEHEEFNVEVGGGAVKATLNGKKELKKLDINPDIIDKDDVEMLTDLVIAAVNEGIRQVKAKEEEMFKSASGNINLPF